MLFRNGKWVYATPEDQSNSVGFNDIKFYYANLIDYARVFMVIWAGFAVHWEQNLLVGVLIILQQLLDWIDGPVARANNQCCIFGSGIDWLADITGQIITMCWWVKLQPSVLPWLNIATTIEVATCIFDFAVTATCKYPVIKNRTGFFYILDWAMPNGCYSKFGTFLWLAYPLYCVVCCWEICFKDAAPTFRTLFMLNQKLLFVPAVMYIWCEAAYGSAVILRWTEPSRTKKATAFHTDGVASGIDHMGVVHPKYQGMISTLFENVKNLNKADYQKATANKTHFWMSIWQRAEEEQSAGESPIYQTGRVTLDGVFDGLDRQVMETFCRSLMKHVYQDVTDIVLDGYGFSVSPKETTRTQPWHLDYSTDYSTIFIPLVQVCPENAVQAMLPGALCARDVLLQAIADPNKINIEALLQGGQVISVRQVYTRAFSILRMGFGAIHRGVANRSGVERPMFYISVSRKGVPPPAYEHGFTSISCTDEERSMRELVEGAMPADEAKEQGARRRK